MWDHLLRLAALPLVALLLTSPRTEGAPILVTWDASAASAVGEITATGSFTVDSAQIGTDINLNGAEIFGSVSDGVHTASAPLRPFGPDHEMALRFTNTSLASLSAVLVDTNGLDNQNDALVFAFSPWAQLAGATCDCEIALLVLHAVGAQNAPSPFFVSATPLDLRGKFDFRFELNQETIPEPSVVGLLAVAASLWFAQRIQGSARAPQR